MWRKCRTTTKGTQSHCELGAISPASSIPNKLVKLHLSNAVNKRLAHNTNAPDWAGAPGGTRTPNPFLRTELLFH